MKKLFNLCIVTIASFALLNSCSSDDRVIDSVLSGVTNGAVLRGDNDTLENTMILDIEPARFFVELEEQDNQDGALLESVDVYVTFEDNSELAGDSSPATTDEVFVSNIPASEFSPGEFGLPVTQLELPLSQLLSLVNLTSDQQIYVNDTFTIRLVLKLTDGREFTVDNTASVLTGGFFNSPFRYVFTVTGGMDLLFTNEGTNEINLGAGAVNEGYSADVSVSEEVEGLFTEMIVYSRYVDNNDGDDTDYTTEEVTLTTIPRSAFSMDDVNDGFDLIYSTLMFDLAQISNGVDLADMSVGDAVELRYSLVNSSGREISALTAPFVQSIPVVSCPVAPLGIADLDMFVGDYELEHLGLSIFGYQTFGEGEVVELFSENVTVVASNPDLNDTSVGLATTERAFYASYLFDLGSGDTQTYIMEFNCTSVTFVDDAAPIGNFTAWACGGNSIYMGSLTGGGSFDVTDDSEFILGFTDDVTDACGQPTTTPAIKFIKQ